MGVHDDTLAHVLAEMERIDLLLRAHVVRARRIHAVDDQFQGLYISEEEVDRLLARPTGVPSWAYEQGERTVDVAEALGRLRDDIQAAVARVDAQRLRLPRLAALCGLDAFAVDCLLICLAPELDLRYERIFAYLQDDVTKKRPTVDLVLGLLCTSPQERLVARERFGPDAPLVRHRLVELVEDGSDHRASLLATPLRIDARIASFLLGSDTIDVRLHPCARLVPAGEAIDGGGDDRLRDRVREFVAGHREGALTVLYVQGAYGSGARDLASAALAPGGSARGRCVLEAEVSLMASGADQLPGQLLALACREAALQDAVPLFTGFDQLLMDGRAPAREQFLRSLRRQHGVVILAGELPWDAADSLPGAAFVRVEIARPAAVRRAALWSAALAGDNGAQSRFDVQGLASKFRFSDGQIRDAVHTARTLARWRSGDVAAPVSNAELYDACRMHSNQRLAVLSRKLVPHYGWSDIVLPPGKLQQLRDLCNQVKYRERVYGTWGFDRKLSRGKGLSALFAGPSGTGKTMAAEIIAGELGLDLYKIDLSSVVSKYIGETEKNLSKIFNEADTSNAILFFDEADALFGKRSEVKDSHDRYANIETGYLLQRIEEHEGVVILATNFRKNLDDAFVRRLQFTVEFSFPNADERRRLWEVVWPAETPRDPAIDFDMLARRFEITGGNVRNIVLAAAFLAADEAEWVTMEHLLRATQRELQKMGKIVADGEFDQPADASRRTTARPAVSAAPARVG